MSTPAASRLARPAPAGVALEPLEPRRLLAAMPGALDPAFGHAGTVTLTGRQRPTDVQTIAAVRLKADKLLLLGQIDTSYGWTFCLTRLNPDGAADPTFGDDGLFIEPLLSSQASVPAGALPENFLHPAALAVDARGRIYIGMDNVVARLHPDGSADQSFGDAGIAETGFDVVNALALDPDGKLLVGGSRGSYYGGDRHDFAVTRLNPADGSPDLAFGTDGIATATFGRKRHALNSAVHALAVDPAGRVLAAGGEDGFLDLARFTPTGAPDPTFGKGTGRTRVRGDAKPNPAVDTSTPGGPFFAALTLRPADGTIFAVGGNPPDYQNGFEPSGPLVVAAFRDSGRLNRAFGANGVVRVQTGGSHNPDIRETQATGVALQRHGKLLVTGQLVDGIVLMRLDATTGTPDLGFAASLPAAPGAPADSGLKYLPTEHQSDFSFDVTGTLRVPDLILPHHGGFIIPLDGGPNGSPYDQLHALKFTADGAPDLAYGTAGIATVSLPSDESLTIDDATGFGPNFAPGVPAPDGTLYLNVRRERAPAAIQVVAPDGSAAQPFRPEPQLQAAGITAQRALAALPDGRLLVEEYADRGTGGAVLARYHPDGSPDLSFGDGSGPNGYGFALGNGGTISQALVRPDGALVVRVHTNFGGFYGPFLDTLYAIDAAGHNVTATRDLPQVNAFATVSALIDMAVAPDGGILLVLAGGNLFPQPHDPSLLTRLRGDTLADDPAFGSAGTVTLATAAGQPAFGGSLAVQPDGRILVATSTVDPATNASVTAVLRYLPDGSPDTTYGQAGTLPLPGVPATSPGRFLRQRDGRLLLISPGYRAAPPAPQGHVLRLNPDGSPDPTFATAGTLTVPDLTLLLTLQRLPDGSEALLIPHVTTVDTGHRPFTTFGQTIDVVSVDRYAL